MSVTLILLFSLHVPRHIVFSDWPFGPAFVYCANILYISRIHPAGLHGGFAMYVTMSVCMPVSWWFCCGGIYSMPVWVPVCHSPDAREQPVSQM